jgi:hypothetical protein
VNVNYIMVAYRGRRRRGAREVTFGQIRPPGRGLAQGFQRA